MSTDTRAAAGIRRGRRRFRSGFIVTVLVLALAGAAGGVATMLQGPRLSQVQADPATAITSSGSRVILTANQALRDIDAGQVSVEPHAEFTVDVSGRNVGIRFTQPLDDSTAYTVRVEDVQGLAGGPVGTLQTTVATPAADLIYLRRSLDGDDVLYRSPVAAGAAEQAVFSHAQIEDFRATPNQLLISVVEDGVGRLIVTDLDGEGARDVRLPGPGFVTQLRVADGSDRFGYVFSDETITSDADRVSQLFLGSLQDPDAEPQAMTVQNEVVSVGSWQFVPDSEALLFIDFASNLMLATPDGSELATLGTATRILGVSRGTYTAIIERLTEFVRIDLRTGADTPLPALETDAPASVEAVVPLAGDQLLWSITTRDEKTMPVEGQLVLAEGASSRVVASSPAQDPIMASCTSPSGSYLALTVGPDYAGSTWDMHLNPLPHRIETRIVRVSDGEQIARFDGFDASWCDSAPF